MMWLVTQTVYIMSLITPAVKIMSPDRHTDRLDVSGHTDHLNHVAGHIYLLPFDVALLTNR